MISRKQIVWVLAGVLLLSFGSAVGQDEPAAPAAPAGPPVEYPDPEEGAGASDQAGNGKTDQGNGDGNGAPGPGGGSNQAPASPFGNWFLPVMIGALLLMFFMSSRGRKKRTKKRQEMLASLKKGAKITTIGGIVGTVMEVREDEITVKVDEQNNVRMRFLRSAIQGVGDGAKKEVGEEGR